MGWIKSTHQLPEEGKFVLGLYLGGDWMYTHDPLYVNCRIVFLKKGKTKEEINKYGPTIVGGSDQSEDNLFPYMWYTFGVDNFFSQEIEYWHPLPYLTKEIEEKLKRNKKWD